MTTLNQQSDRNERPYISVVVPVFNEEAAIAADLACIFDTLEKYGRSFEVIVVDDGSTDNSLRQIAQFQKVRLLQHPKNRGTGAARTTGMLAALGEFVVMTDGDGTYPNGDMPKLIDALVDSDMVIGARLREAGTMKILRAPAKAAIRLLASYLTGEHIPDLNSGFRAMRRSAALNYLDILPKSHSWVSTITIAELCDGLRVRFIPIEYYVRKGRSSFHPVRDTYNYVTLIVRTIIYFDPLKIFLPPTLVLGACAMVKFLYDLVAYRFHLAPSTILLILATINLFAIGMLADLIVRRTKH